MLTVPIQNRSMPRLGLGTYELTDTECRDVVEEALRLGYRHIDTAEAYGNEAAIGEALADSGLPRNELFLTTKVWWENLGADQVRQHLEASLERLRTDYVDLLLIHWPDPERSLAEPLGSLQQLQSDGRTKLIGVSNFTPELLEKAVARAPIACNQVEYHPFLAQDELLKKAREHHMVLTAYCPIARNEVAGEPVLAEIGRRYGKSPAQVTLRWLVQQDVVAAIPRSAKREHLADNIDIFDFELDDDEMERISGLERGERLIDPAFAPDW